MHMHFNHNNYGIMISTLGNELQHDKAQCRSIKMANKIRRIPHRTKELLLQQFQSSGTHDGQCSIPHQVTVRVAGTVTTLN